MKRHVQAIAVVMAVCMSVCGSIPRDAAATIISSPIPSKADSRFAAPSGELNIVAEKGAGRATNISRWSRAIVLIVILVIIILLIYRSFRGWKPTFS